MDAKKKFAERPKKSGPQPKIVGLPRNEFGTRLCHRIVCHKCRKTDYVARLIGQAKNVYCRKCAESVLDAYDAGRIIAALKVETKCEKCHRKFLVTEAVAEKKESLMCLDCYRGFDVWRGKISDNYGEQKRTTTIRRLGANTIIRKVSNDTI